MMPMTSSAEPEAPLPDLSDEGDRPSITDAGGTVARFEMAYEPPPKERIPFPAPMWARLPSLVWLGFGLMVTALVTMAYTGSSNSTLYVWLVEGDRNRPLPASVLAGIVLASGLATVLRAQMRGVVLHGDGVEARDLMPLGIPRVRRWLWAQIHRVIIDDTKGADGTGVAFEMWDGAYEKLPEVAKGAELARLLEQRAGGRGITVTRLGRE
jgi:hypothetical protein